MTDRWLINSFSILTGLLLLAGCETLQPRGTPVPSLNDVPPATAITPEVVAQSVRPDAPLRYVVRRGDTLWDISNRFLRDPFLWPEIWTINRQIKNPHLIYPGDILLLEWINGRPTVRRENDLGPRIRVGDAAIPVINPKLLAPFLKGPRLVDVGELESAPYLLRTVSEHLLASQNDQVYVRGFGRTPGLYWQLLRRNRDYIDPDTGDLLGVETIYVGDGVLERPGDPGVILLTSTRREGREGDRFLPPPFAPMDLLLTPSAPEQPIVGQIISAYDGIENVVQYQIVTLNKGLRDGLQPGHVLAADKRGRLVADETAGAISPTVQLPNEPAGLMLVFKTYQRFSYALVMQTERPLGVGDIVRNP